MLKEVLLALLGFTGDVIVEADGKFVLSGALHVMSQAEIELIDDLASTGYLYRDLRRFVQETSNTIFVKGVGDGLLRFSLANEIDLALNNYERAVVEMEAKSEGDKGFTLLHVRSGIWEHGIVLRYIHDLLKLSSSGKYDGPTGGKLLSLLHDAALSGSPYIAKAMGKCFCACFSDYFTYAASFIYLEESDTRAVLDDFMMRRASDPEEMKWPFYSLRPEHVPDFLQPSVVSKLLFMKNAMVSLRHRKTPREYRLTDSDIRQDMNRLLELRSSRIDDINSVVEDPFLRLSGHLTDLLVQGGQLLDAFKLVKQVILLMNGELYSNFFSAAFEDLSEGETTNKSLRALNAKFHNSLMVVLPNLSDGSVYSFKFVKSGSDGSLSLAYTPEWPLMLVFSDGSLKLYTNVFNIIFPIARTNYRLRKAAGMVQRLRNCEMALQRGGGDRLENETKIFKLQLLFFEINRVIISLLSYLHLSVIPVHFQDFMEKLEGNIETRRDIMEILTVLHPSFIQNVSSSCFSQMGVVSRSLAAIIKRADQFCDFTGVAMGNITLLKLDRIEALKSSFRRELLLFMSLLAQLNAVHASQHLNTLVSSINYNGWLDDV